MCNASKSHSNQHTQYHSRLREHNGRYAMAPLRNTDELLAVGRIRPGTDVQYRKRINREEPISQQSIHQFIWEQANTANTASNIRQLMSATHHFMLPDTHG